MAQFACVVLVPDSLKGIMQSCNSHKICRVQFECHTYSKVADAAADNCNLVVFAETVSINLQLQSMY